MNAVLDNESPQLVVLNGDLITGLNVEYATSTDCLPKIVEPMVQRSLPWASTYGNHDSDTKLLRKDLFDRETSFENSYTQNMLGTFGVDTGVTNYYLPIYSADADSASSTPAAILWFFDSRGGAVYKTITGIPGRVDQSVVDWFINTKQNLAKKYGSETEIPSLAFVHIPTFAAQSFQQQGVSATQEPGINCQIGLSTQGDNTGADNSFAKALLDTAGLIAVFSGHDHGVDWCFKWDSTLPNMDISGNGLNMCFGRHSGYGGYGRWTRGSRQVVLDLANPKEVKTWIRLESNRVTEAVTLNETYGSDQYPKERATYTRWIWPFGEEHNDPGPGETDNPACYLV